MQLKVLFGRKSHGCPGFWKEKNKSHVFFDVIFDVYTNRKELERVIENKGDKFRGKKNMEIQRGTEKIRNASSQQGENEQQWKRKANMNTGNKILGEHIQQFVHKNNV